MDFSEEDDVIIETSEFVETSTGDTSTTLEYISPTRYNILDT